MSSYGLNAQVTGFTTLGNTSSVTPFRVYNVSGTMPAVGNVSNISFPSGVTSSKILAVMGLPVNGQFMNPQSDPTDTSRQWRLYINRYLVPNMVALQNVAASAYTGNLVNIILFVSQ
jgi:hypothetical protein